MGCLNKIDEHDSHIRVWRSPVCQLSLEICWKRTGEPKDKKSGIIQRKLGVCQSCLCPKTAHAVLIPAEKNRSACRDTIACTGTKRSSRQTAPGAVLVVNGTQSAKKNMQVLLAYEVDTHWKFPPTSQLGTCTFYILTVKSLKCLEHDQTHMFTACASGSLIYGLKSDLSAFGHSSWVTCLR